MAGMISTTLKNVLTIGTVLTLAACAPSNGTGTGSSSSSSSSVASSSASSAYADMIQVTSPKPNAALSKSKPVLISGRAVGPWYFEASFPVKITDSLGNVLAEGPAQAQADWMTTNFVPFQATLNLSPTTATSGFLVLQNDNPSGLPENAKSISIPVTFVP